MSDLLDTPLTDLEDLLGAWTDVGEEYREAVDRAARRK